MYYKRQSRKDYDPSVYNNNLMSPERKIQLSDLQEKYGDTALSLSLDGFGLNPAKIQEIEGHNEDIKLRNTEIKTKTEKINAKISIIIVLFLSISNVAAILLLILYLNQPIPLVVIASSLIFIGIGDLLSKKFLKKVNHQALPLHPLSAELNEYKQVFADNILFIQLSEEERKDKKERSKREFWFSLNGFQFEKQMAKLFEKNGYKAHVTKGTGDGGIDINLFDGTGSRTIVQCKAHKKPIGPHEARAIYGLMLSEKAQRAMLVSLGGFTQGVRDYIKGKNIRLMDIDDVMRFCQFE